MLSRGRQRAKPSESASAATAEPAKLSRAEKGWLQQLIGTGKPLPDTDDKKELTKAVTAAMADKKVLKNVNEALTSNQPGVAVPRPLAARAVRLVDLVVGDAA